MTELMKALAAFQDECPVLYKDSTAGSGKFSYKYVELPNIITQINPILRKHGLVFYQSHQSTVVNGTLWVGVSTTLTHIESGDSIHSHISSEVVDLNGMNDYQSLGSLSTYLRRYDLSTLLGLVTEKDDDAAGVGKRKSATKAVQTTKSDLPASGESYDKVAEFIKKGGNWDVVLGKYNVSKTVKDKIDAQKANG